MIYVGILGHGTVGSGVVEVLLKNVDSIAKRAGREIKVKRVLDLRDFPGLSYSHLFTSNVEDVLGDDDIKIIVEVMGGINPAYNFTKRALESGKHVVTSNKELIALHGPELQKIAWKNDVNYLFEASVGGGIPIIRPLKQCLAGNEIFEISGILNGTTNFILSEMKKKNKDFSEALSDAKAKGYAEKDPTADIEGHDTQRKIAILSTIAFEQQILFSDIATEGITKVTKEDIICAEELGYIIKLVAHAKKDHNGVYARVSPLMLPVGHPLADVEDVFNAILVKGDAIGDVMFYGRGAGKLPTASAVVGDIIEAAKYIGGNGKSDWQELPIANILNTNSIADKFVIRVGIKTKDVFNREVKALLPKAQIHYSNNQLLSNEAVIIIEGIIESDLEQMRNKLNCLSSVEAVINTIRVAESLN